MRRVLFHCFGWSIHSYPAMLYVGIVLGIYAQLFAALSLGLDTTRVFAATIVLVAAALLGARLLHIVPNWQHYRKQPQDILKVSAGGASMYGGLLLGFPLSYPVLGALEIPFGAYWDTCSFTMLIGMTITRAGCFLNGCCAGRATTAWWGLNLPDYRGIWRRRIPLQILEACWGIVVTSGALLLWGRLGFGGAIFLYALGAYGAGRIVLETLRDAPDRVAGISLHRALSAIFVATSLSAFAIAWLS
jgi:phosphatidylglycerol:prolipoprotein diacylglycerol transferase